MGSYWTTVLGGDRQTATFPAFLASTSGTGVLVQAQRNASVPLGVQAFSAFQTANLTKWRSAAGPTLSTVTKDGNLGILTSPPVSSLDVNGSNSHAIVRTSTSQTLNATHHTVIINLLSTPAITLPDPTTCTGRVYVIVNRSTGARNVGGYSFSSFTLAVVTTVAAQSTITLQSNGTGWYQFQ